jgi:prephenate dehydrogenase
VAGRADDAVRRGVLDRAGVDPDAELTFVAVPVIAALDAVQHALKATSGVVTDVGSVKGALCEAIEDERFVGGHPMAGSELEGLDGADAAMFNGAVWVLTPTAATSHVALSTVARAVHQLGAEMVAMSPARHDDTVAVVSHVPHLTAASLMGLAADGADEHAALLRLAAGGFRDMTRIASGHPGIWLDICQQNRAAIVDGLDRLIAGLGEMRAIVDAGDGDALLARLQRARSARSNLPSRISRPEQLAEVRIPIPDRLGAAAEIFTLAAREAVNIASFEVVHLAESNVGVAVVLVDADVAERYRAVLAEHGYHAAVTPLA